MVESAVDGIMEYIIGRKRKPFFIIITLFLVLVMMLKLWGEDWSVESPITLEEEPAEMWLAAKRVAEEDNSPVVADLHNEYAIPAKQVINIDGPVYNNALPNPYVTARNLTDYGKSIMAFMHNPKSGGTTLKDCLLRLTRELQLERPLLVTPGNREETQRNIFNGIINPDKYNFMMGGASLGICESFSSRKCSYFTIVREPYDRMISHYFFCKDGGESSIPCENKSIEEFTLTAGSIFFAQLALGVTCHCDNNCDDISKQPWHCVYDYPSYYKNIEHKDEFLQFLIQHLDSYFAVIGLTEEYDTTLTILQSTFGVPFHNSCSGVQSNAGKYGSKGTTNSDERKLEAKRRMLASEAVRRTLYPDVMLYERAKQIFQMQKDKLHLT
ncbi:hypothetical protein HOLleu_16095 [Holothuria leucospilota]|uniref:Sulfotransferase n=1 Tax=Holothuria leucospilota TaxID=206669 RepID=A0A9Q1HAE1_HOLLE|nr:hypothetical protein HOLleu_16095 [Holothuria leucospilota]